MFCQAMTGLWQPYSWFSAATNHRPSNSSTTSTAWKCPLSYGQRASTATRPKSRTCTQSKASVSSSRPCVTTSSSFSKSSFPSYSQHFACPVWRHLKSARTGWSSSFGTTWTSRILSCLSAFVLSLELTTWPTFVCRSWSIWTTIKRSCSDIPIGTCRCIWKRIRLKTFRLRSMLCLWTSWKRNIERWYSMIWGTFSFHQIEKSWYLKCI